MFRTALTLGLLTQVCVCVCALTRVVNGQTEQARMDLVFNLDGSVTYLDVSIVAPFSCSPSLVSAASTKTRTYAKRAEKTKFDRYPHINLVPFILQTTSRPGPHSRKFVSHLMRDADNPPNSCQRHLVHHPKCPPQCHVQTTTHSRRYVIPGDQCHTQFYFQRIVLPRANTVLTGTHTAFSAPSLLQPCHVALL